MAAIIPHLLYMSLIASFIGVLCWNIGNKITTPLNGILFTDVVPVGVRRVDRRDLQASDCRSLQPVSPSCATTSICDFARGQPNLTGWFQAEPRSSRIRTPSNAGGVGPPRLEQSRLQQKLLRNATLETECRRSDHSVLCAKAQQAVYAGRSPNPLVELPALSTKSSKASNSSSYHIIRTFDQTAQLAIPKHLPCSANRRRGQNSFSRFRTGRLLSTRLIGAIRLTGTRRR